MMNPSAQGWIDKYFSLQPVDPVAFATTEAFYAALRQTGFVYGYPQSFLTHKPIDSGGWIEEERSKLGLLIALHRLYLVLRPEAEVSDFLADALRYYGQMSPKGFPFLHKLFPGGSPSHRLEEILSERVQTNDNIVSRHFSHIVTNALLFVDVIGFAKFLSAPGLPYKFLKRLEELIISVVSLALRTKPVKTDYDDLLIRLFDSSLRYGSLSGHNDEAPENLPLELLESQMERLYLLDLAGLALWSDGAVENPERHFLFQLGKILSLEASAVRESLEQTNAFISNNRNQLSYFRYSNPVKHFYDQMSENVAVLIRRNRVRLAKEISQSGELVRLLAASATRDLDAKEKKKVRKQLLDICKSIPSLTIFLLPGGTLLLPILIKFIPKMLPSAFNENLETE